MWDRGARGGAPRRESVPRTCFNAVREHAFRNALIAEWHYDSAGCAQEKVVKLRLAPGPPCADGTILKIILDVGVYMLSCLVVVRGSSLQRAPRAQPRVPGNAVTAVGTVQESHSRHSCNLGPYGLSACDAVRSRFGRISVKAHAE